MSRTVDVDLTFRPPTSLEVIFSCLAEGGWSPAREGKINYMADDFDWHYVEEGSDAQVLSALNETLEAGNVAGISMWTDEGHGANVLIFPGLEKVSFSLDLNRRMLAGSATFADLGWYLQRIVPVLESVGLTGVTATDTP
jgi:hypothetical protein